MRLLLAGPPRQRRTEKGVSRRLSPGPCADALLTAAIPHHDATVAVAVVSHGVPYENWYKPVLVRSNLLPSDDPPLINNNKSLLGDFDNALGSRPTSL